jgi:hypothetical protein
MPIDLRNLDNYGIFKLFWKTHGDPDLSGEGLNEVSTKGAQKLYDYAMSHELDGTESAANRRVIDDDEKALFKALLEHPHYGAFFEADGRVKLIELIRLNPADVHGPNITRPKKDPAIDLGDRVSAYGAAQLASTEQVRLPLLFADEYRKKAGVLEAANVAPEERSKKVLALFRDYTTALWAKGETEQTEDVGNKLLDALEKTRSGMILGSKDPNGAPWNLAQSLVLGMDPNAYPTEFPKAHKAGEVTYLAMHGEMQESMKWADEWRAAFGLEKKASAYEGLSPLGWLIGEESGHLKRGNLDEKQPFASSGLNWGIVLFPGDEQIRSLPPKPGFEFPIDCLDGFSSFIVCKPKAGDKLVVRDQQGRPVKVEKQIQMENGKPVSWTAKFSDAQGKEIAPDKVLGVIVDARGNVKGDGRAANNVNMWWWGFCDRNTAQVLYKSKFQIPQLARDTIKVKANGKIIEVPKADAQKLIDCDMPDLVTQQTFCGFRFNANPQKIVLKSGESITAKVGQEVFDSGAATTRLSGDVVAIHDGPGRPLLGTLDVDGQQISVRDIISITKGEGDKVTVKVKNEWRDTVEGKLNTKVPWDKAVQEDGKTVLKQTPDFAIRGALTVTLADGTSKGIELSDIVQVVGETQRDLRISQFAAWVGQEGGMFATDGSMGEVVSNGMRWVNAIEEDVRQGDDRPDWAPKGDLLGVEGELVRAPGDRLCWMRAKFAMEEGADPNSTAFSGWVQLSKDGRILNEGFSEGEPDFGWSGHGPLNWLAPSTFNPYMDPNLRVALFVNGVKERGAELDALAKRLNLPENYKDLLVPQNGE